MTTRSAKILPPIRPQQGSDPLQSMFESALNLPPEEADRFRAIVRDFAEALPPADVLGRFWVLEAAVALFEVIRFQEIERRWIASDRDEAISHLLVGRVVGVESLLREARLGRAEANAEVEELLVSHNLSEADIVAQAYRNSAEEIERLRRLGQRASAKLGQIVRDIENRRLRLPANLRALVEQKALPQEGGK